MHDAHCEVLRTGLNPCPAAPVFFILEKMHQGFHNLYSVLCTLCLINKRDLVFQAATSFDIVKYSYDLRINRATSP